MICKAIENIEIIYDLLDLNKELIKNPVATFYFRVSGNMMKSAGINDGDILIIDRSLDPKDKCVVVAVIDGDYEVKRYVENNCNPYIVSDDNLLSTVDISCSEVEIWGVVVYSIHST